MVEGSGVGGDLLKKSVTLVLVNALSNDASLFCNPMLALMIFFFFFFFISPVLGLMVIKSNS